MYLHEPGDQNILINLDLWNKFSPCNTKLAKCKDKGENMDKKTCHVWYKSILKGLSKVRRQWFIHVHVCLPLVVWLMQVSLFSVLNEQSWLSDKEACLDLVLIQVLQKKEKSYSWIAILWLKLVEEANKRKHDGTLVSVWTLDGKVYVKTSPSGSPIRINFLSDLNDL